MFLMMAILISSIAILFAFTFRRAEPPKKTKPFLPPKGCVFRTIMGEESSANHFVHKTPENVQRAVDQGLLWIIQAQHENGGWGAGSHHRQDIRDPHAVPTDPATTAMVAMSMLRSGTTLTSGRYSRNLGNALNHLLDSRTRRPGRSQSGRSR